MKDRVRELRERLAPVLEIVSESARRDLEELFELARRPEGESVRLLREVRDALDLVELATGVKRPSKNGAQPALHALLADVLRERRAPLTARELAAEVAGRGTDARLADVRDALARAEFVQVGRFRYELARTGAEPRPKPAARRRRASAAATARRATRRPEAEADGESGPGEPDSLGRAGAGPSERTEPKLLDRVRALFAREQAPLAAKEIAKRLLTDGWTTRSARPENVISALLSKAGEFERANGKYRFTASESFPAPVAPRNDAPAEPTGEDRDDSEPDSTASAVGSVAETAAPRKRATRPEVPLGRRIRAILARRGAALTYDEILDELERGGWTSTSERKRDLVSNAVRLDPELELVLPGVVWFRTPAAESSADVAEGEPASPAPSGVPAAPAIAEPSEPSADLADELAFLRQHIEDARDDTAVLAPAYASRQVSAWAARARSIAERAGGQGLLADECRAIVRQLGALAKSWWLGRRPLALTTWASPREVLAPYTKEEHGAEASWEHVADRLDAQLEGAYDDATFDDGWSDTRWLADDERFATERLDRTEALLERIGAPFGGPPAITATLALGPKELRELVEAARGLRWVRGVALDGARWGLCVGRLRWLAEKHPAVKESTLAEVLTPEHQPAGTGWGFDEDAGEEKRRWLTDELERTNGALDEWLTRAVECFDDADLARLLTSRARDLSQIDLRRIDSRRIRARIAKLMDTMGVASNGHGVPLPDLGEEPPRVPRFPTVRALLAETLPRRRALMLTNRADPTLERVLRAALDLELEWCVATARRAHAAADAIRSGHHDLVLSATGFHTPAMDADFARAAREARVPFARVNRARPASCARAIVRSLPRPRAALSERVHEAPGGD